MDRNQPHAMQFKHICKFPAIILLVAALFFSGNTHAQKVYVTKGDTLFELTGGPGNCTYKAINSLCDINGDGIFSCAVYKDIFYFITTRADLYSVNLSTPGSCKKLTSFPQSMPGFGTMNSATVDKDGNLYTADWGDRSLYRYDPATNTIKNLGQLPARPGGDLMFYEGKLLYSTESNGIYEVNLADIPNSQQFMETVNYQFWGLISFPFQCDKNKMYGLATTYNGTALVEVDLANKIIIGEACSLPFTVYDAASSVEDGNTVGVSIDSIIINPPCDATLKGSATIVSHTASSGILTYTMDNLPANNTGIFENLSLGMHQFKVSNERGCEHDSSFILKTALDAPITFSISHPQSCFTQDGAIVISTVSNYAPVKYSINNSAPVTNNSFLNLKAGKYNITAFYGADCRMDTSIMLYYTKKPDYFSSIAVTPTTCEKKSGIITVNVPANVIGVTASLNNGTPTAKLTFINLDAGDYTLTLHYQGACDYDTLIHIHKLSDPMPAITITTTNQFCYVDNGLFTIQASGANAPFLFSVNSGGFSNNGQYSNLAPGTHPIVVKNSNNCIWDTAAIILPYQSLPITYTVDKMDVDCKTMNDGAITVLVTGDESPYTLKWNETIFDHTIENLAPGNYAIQILNNDNCAIDTAKATLDIIPDPACDNVFFPTAFTPNGDGNNDSFGPLHNSYIKDISFTVYNRFGQAIFSSRQSNPRWDGTISGKPQPSGLYIYIYSYETYLHAQKTAKGYFNIVR